MAPDAIAVLVEALETDDSHTPEGVSEVTGRLIREGAIAVGSRLPTIRDLSRRAGLSTSTVVAAWSELRRAGLIETNRRGGTVVISKESPGHAAPAAWSERDLLTGSPDYALQPDLLEAILAGLRTDELNHPGRDYITDQLRVAVADGWPFPAQAYVAAGGGSEGLLLAVLAAATPGTPIAVEHPAMPGFLDTLGELGYPVIGIESDEQGAQADSLDAALKQKPSVVVLQPEGSYSEAGALTPARAAELATVLARASHRPWIVEDDAVGPLAREQAPSLGIEFGDRTVRVRSYCKAYGMDIKTCVIGGSQELVERAIRTRVHGIALNSRILQNALAYLAVDEAAHEVVDAARARYAARRDALVTLLRERGATAAAGPNSLVVWVRVRDETGALLELARRRIVVGSGGKSYAEPLPYGLLRIAVPQLPDDPAAIADLADAVVGASARVHREFLD